MIKIENTEVWGFEGAIRGARNPMNSWDKSDSTNCAGYYECDGCPANIENDDGSFDCESNYSIEQFVFGDNDLNLAKTLGNAKQRSHGKFLRMIHVQVDVTAPMYWWSEFDTYKIGTVANSCSKMHKMLARPFEMKDFSFNKLYGYKNEVKQFQPTIDEEIEIWRKYDVDYDVSNQGRVRHGSRILSGSIHSDGYKFVTIHGKQIAVHRMVCEKFLPNPQNKKEVNHIDGNKLNNFIDNLEWATRSENQKHAVDNCLQPNLTSSYTGKFTKEERDEIKRLNDSGEMSRRQIAKKFDVSHTCINDIVNDKYKYAGCENVYNTVAKPIIDTLNELRDSWIMEDDVNVKKQVWYEILQLLPVSYNQLRTVDLNYETLRTMYFDRKNHKLDEWNEFCKWIESLPYMKEFLNEQ